MNCQVSGCRSEAEDTLAVETKPKRFVATLCTTHASKVTSLFIKGEELESLKAKLSRRNRYSLSPCVSCTYSRLTCEALWELHGVPCCASCNHPPIKTGGDL